MSENDYIRNPKGTKGGKYGPSEQDEADFKQEKLIKEWLEREGRADDFRFEHINRKGNARNTGVRAQVRLDQKIQADGSGTFADFIAGCDGRDLECAGGDRSLDLEPLSAADRLENELNLFFDAIGVPEGTKKWAMKSVKSAESLRKLQSLMKEEKQLQISPISLELLKPLPNFKE